MAITPKQPERERRIYDEIIVDAYGEVEHAMGWYYYLESRFADAFQSGMLCATVRTAVEGW